jgi:hypothetical protein
MPAFQSFAEFGLTQKYHLNAIGCEKQAQQATDLATEQEWQQLAAQRHVMADQAAKLLGDNDLESQNKFFLF